MQIEISIQCAPAPTNHLLRAYGVAVSLLWSCGMIIRDTMWDVGMFERDNDEIID